MHRILYRALICNALFLNYIRGSAVDVATGYRLNDQGIGVRFLVG
jgi:hypothetical protein